MLQSYHGASSEEKGTVTVQLLRSSTTVATEKAGKSTGKMIFPNLAALLFPVSSIHSVKSLQYHHIFESNPFSL